MVEKAVARGYRVREVPIKYHYREKGVAKIDWRCRIRPLYALVGIRLPSGFSSKPILRLGLLSMVLLAFALRFRWLLLAVQSSMPLSPDAAYYMSAASELMNLSYRSFREPMFPLIAALFLSVLGVSIATFRFSTVFLGTLIVPLTYQIARRTSSMSAGLLASFLVATNILLIYNSIRGLREELFSCLLLAFLFLVVQYGHRLTAKVSMISGFLAAILCLTKLEGLIVVAGVSAYHVWWSKISQRKIDWRFVAIVLGSSIIAIFAWLGYSTLVFNNPFETTNVVGGMWYYYEFGEVKRVSVFDYIFRYHTAEQILFLAARGTVRMLLMLNQLWFLTPVGFGLLCLGFLSLLKSERSAVLHFALLSSLLSYTFFFGIGEKGADARLLCPYMPIFYLMIASASMGIYTFLAKHRETLIKLGFILDLRIWENRRVKLDLSVLPVLLPFAVATIHLAGALLLFRAVP